MLRTYDPEKETAILKDAIRKFPLEWFNQNEWYLLAQGVGDLLLIALGVWASLAYPTLWVCIPAWILVAARFHALGVLTHDLGHYVSLTRWPFRRLLCELFICYPILLNVDFFAHAHAIHHETSNLPGKDPYYLPLHRWNIPRYLLAAVLSAMFLPTYLTIRLLVFPLTLISKKARELHVRFFSIFGFSPYFANEGPFSNMWKGVFFYVVLPIVVTIFAVQATIRFDLVVWKMHYRIIYFLVPLFCAVFFAATRLSKDEMAEDPDHWHYVAGPTIFWYGVAALLTYQGWWTEFLWAYFIPLTLMVPVFFFRLSSDHVGGEARNNSIVEQLASTTNMEPPWYEEFLIGPHSAPRHGFHHVAPSVPNWYWLDGHRVFAACSEVYRSTLYPGYAGVFARMYNDHKRWLRGEGDYEVLHGAEPPMGSAEEIDLEPRLPRAPEGHHVAVSSLTTCLRDWEAGREGREGRAELPDPDTSLPRLPEELGTLACTEAWTDLPEEGRNTCLQAAADALLERALFMKERVILPGLSVWLARSRDPRCEEVYPLLELMVEEEAAKADALRARLGVTVPCLSEKGTFFAYRLSPDQDRWLSKVLRVSRKPVWWVWAALLSHEQILHVAGRVASAGEAIGAPERECHDILARDTRPLFMMDHHLLRAFWDSATVWTRKREGGRFHHFIRSWMHPSRVVNAELTLLRERHPDLEPLVPLLRHQGQQLGDSRDWHEKNYSRAVLPQTFALMDEYRELDVRRPPFPLYHPYRKKTEPALTRVAAGAPQATTA